MRRLVALAGSVAVLAAPAPALAAGGGSGYSISQTLYSFGGPQITHLTVTTMPARVTGGVSVSFGPDARTGCAALDACAYRGSLVTNVGRQATVAIQRYVQSGRHHVEAELILGDQSSNATPVTYEEVQRTSAAGQTGHCADEAQAGAGARVTRSGAGFTVSLSALSAPTRCAGPLPSDLSGLLPTVRLPAEAFLAGGATLDFRTMRSFVRHGFAGTLTSTIVIRLGHPSRPRGQIPSSNVFPPGMKTIRERFVTESLSVTAASGSLTLAFKGTPDTSVCVLLDSCGIAGTLRLTPSPGATTAQGQLTAIGPAQRPYRDFLAALGLGSGGRAAGISAFGFITWGDHGTLRSQAVQAGTCSDTATLGSGSASIIFGRHGAEVGYLPTPFALSGGPGPRTRCPGPLLNADHVGAIGRVTAAVARHLSFSVTAKAAGSFSDDGYALSLSGVVELAFHRGRISQQILSTPSGF